MKSSLLKRQQEGSVIGSGNERHRNKVCEIMEPGGGGQDSK